MSDIYSVRLKKELREKLESFANETDRSMAYHIQKAIEIYLEDQIDLKIASSRLHEKIEMPIPFPAMEDKFEL